MATASHSPTSSPTLSSTRRNTVLVGLWTGVSRLLGLVREMLSAKVFGTSLIQSAFVVAFTIPNLLRRLFGEGALSASFIPAFSKSLENESRTEAEHLGRRVLTLLGLFLSTFVVLGIGITFIIGIFIEPDGRLGTILPLLRIMFPYAVFICMAAICMGMLNVLGDFRTPAFAPALLNIVWIGVLLGVCPFLKDEWSRIVAVSWGVVFAGFLQFWIQWRQLRRKGWSFKAMWSGWLDSRVVYVWKQALPAAIGAGVIQINVCLDFGLAMWASEWAPSTLMYAERILYLPLGLISTAMGTVLLPTFSKQYAQGDTQGIKDSLCASLKDMALVMIPATIGLIVLAFPIVELLYQRGAFDATATLRTTRALWVYAPGLVVFSMQKIVSPLFYGMHDVKTPMRVAVASVFVNATLNVILILTFPTEWKHVGIAASTVVCSFLACAVLAVIAQRRIGRIAWGGIVSVSLKALLAAAVMAVAAWWSHGVLAKHTLSVIALGVSIAVGGAAYLAVLALLYPQGARQLLKRRRGNR